MRLHEYEATEIFDRYGIAAPERSVAETPEQALSIARTLGCPVVIKAQVLMGGRGLAGGIRVAQSPDDALTISAELLGSEIKELPVRRVLVAKKLDVADELYLGITIDGYEGKSVVLVSTEGGVSIEEVAKESPNKIASVHLDPRRGLLPYMARRLWEQVGFSSRLLPSVAEAVVRLYGLFVACDAIVAEINPLAVLPTGDLFALDAVLELDDSALFRQRNHIPRDPYIANPLERKARDLGLRYVDMDGDIGIISSGAGLGMATMDIIAQKYAPANFMETGGGITADLLYGAMDLMMMKKNLRAVFINLYGGINPIHEGAEGIVRFLTDRGVNIPIVAKALGNRQEETWEILRSGGVHVVTDVATEKAVARLFDILGN